MSHSICLNLEFNFCRFSLSTERQMIGSWEMCKVNNLLILKCNFYLQFLYKTLFREIHVLSHKYCTKPHSGGRTWLGQCGDFVSSEATWSVCSWVAELWSTIHRIMHKNLQLEKKGTCYRSPSHRHLSRERLLPSCPLVEVMAPKANMWVMSWMQMRTWRRDRLKKWKYGGKS